MRIGVPKETFPGERRVALVPTLLPPLTKAGLEIAIETGAGEAAGFGDADYEAKGAKIIASRDAVFADSDVVVQVRAGGANPDAGKDDLARLRKGLVVIAMFDPLQDPQSTSSVATTGATAFSMELIPRISRAQSMDALSSMATIAGYKAVLLAANCLPRMFPMLMTASGTIHPAKVFIIGAGVAGLQAIASARRLGAVVEAYDVRAAVKEQVMSVGAKFVEMEELETGEAEDKGGYAKEQDESFLKRQRELMARVVAENDVIITTAAIPGKKAPLLITAAMVEGMRTGSVIVDLAAETGGNCELTEAGETVVHGGVSILGPVNIVSTIPYDASRMYAKNISTFLLHLHKEGELQVESDDEIIRETRLTHGGEVVHPRIKTLLENPKE